MRLCAVCGSPRNIERAHLTAKGLGGRGVKAPPSAHDTADLCAGTGGNTDPTSCHGAQHAHELDLRRGPDGRLEYRAKGSTANRLQVADGGWYFARYEDIDADAVDL